MNVTNPDLDFDAELARLFRLFTPKPDPVGDALVAECEAFVAALPVNQENEE